MPSDASHLGKLAEIGVTEKVSASGFPVGLKLGLSLSVEFAILSKRYLGWRSRLLVSPVKYRHLL